MTVRDIGSPLEGSPLSRAVAGAELSEYAARARDNYVVWLRRNFWRLFRYAATSGMALGVSELTLLVLYATRTLDAAAAAICATLAGTIPSYLLSRYWIWSDADRTRAGRQVVLYWVTSLVAMVLTSVGTGAIASLSPAGHRYHVLVAAVGFLCVNLALWITKFVVYQKLIFRQRRLATRVS